MTAGPSLIKNRMALPGFIAGRACRQGQVCTICKFNGPSYPAPGLDTQRLNRRNRKQINEGKSTQHALKEMIRVPTSAALRDKAQHNFKTWTFILPPTTLGQSQPEGSFRTAFVEVCPINSVRYLFSAAEKRMLHRLNAVLYRQSALRLHRHLNLDFDLNAMVPLENLDHDHQAYFQVYSQDCKHLYDSGQKSRKNSLTMTDKDNRRSIAAKSTDCI